MTCRFASPSYPWVVQTTMPLVFVDAYWSFAPINPQGRSKRIRWSRPYINRLAQLIRSQSDRHVSLLRAHETNQSGTIGVCTRCAIHGRASENARAPNCQV